MIFIAAFCSCTAALGQTDVADTVEYVHGLPVTGEDTITENDNDLREEFLEKIPKQHIPKQLIKTLRDDALYGGWERNPVYRNRKTGLYIVTVMESDSVKRVFGFNDNGKAITFDESTVQD